MEVPEYLHRPQRFPEHRLRGELWLASSIRVISHRLSNFIPLIKYELPRKDILLLDITRQYVVTRGFFLAYHYSKFYVDQGEVVPSREGKSAAMLGLLFNTVDYTQVLQ
jgi:hypothetical protein